MTTLIDCQLYDIRCICMKIIENITSNNYLYDIIPILNKNESYKLILMDIQNLLEIIKQNKQNFKEDINEIYITNYYESNKSKFDLVKYYKIIDDVSLIIYLNISFYNTVNRFIKLYDDYLNIYPKFKLQPTIKFLNYYDELTKYKKITEIIDVLVQNDYNIDKFYNEFHNILNKSVLISNEIPDIITSEHKLIRIISELKDKINNIKNINNEIYNQLIKNVDIIKHIIEIDVNIDILTYLNIKTFDINRLISRFKRLINYINRLNLINIKLYQLKENNKTLMTNEYLINNIVDIIFNESIKILYNDKIFNKPIEKIDMLNELIIDTFN